ncbi:HD-GYP domain-containing protein [Vogesella sp. LIG4]|uniref:HD-GYP domain-containing protein n=1 Tax=Vogesella sp. LIG4 TaxID=1192162 RepID=UPI00081FC0A1|nr:HD domain-containing phosphohydrolase [Vogesella sp. LIG4]SCK18873.1 HD domain-containing protein [Vogesella sp. LIG4]
MMISPSHYQLPDSLFVQNRLQQLGDWHYALTDKFRQRLYRPHQGLQLPVLPAPQPDALQEIQALAQHFRQLQYLAPPMLQAEDLSALLTRLDKLAARTTDGAVAAMMLCPWQDYTAQHGINTTLLACLLGRALQLPTEQQSCLTLAALCMNLGSAGLHNELAQQEGSLSTTQRKQLDIHPLVSSALLRELGFDSPLLHQAVLGQHECPDGSGYPFHLGKEQISPLAQLLRLIDISSAKLMPRSYRQAVPAQRALAQLYTQADEQFDPVHTAQLVKILGVYPTGSFVRLASGETAIVVAQGEQLNRPQLAPLRDLDQRQEIDSNEIGAQLTVQVEERHLQKLRGLWPLV